VFRLWAKGSGRALEVSSHAVCGLHPVIADRRTRWKSSRKHYPSVVRKERPETMAAGQRVVVLRYGGPGARRRLRGEGHVSRRASARRRIEADPPTCSGLRSCRLRQQLASGPGPWARTSLTTTSTRPGLPGRSGRGVASAAPGSSADGLAWEGHPERAASVAGSGDLPMGISMGTRTP
jgi:hypothetical protein